MLSAQTDKCAYIVNSITYTSAPAIRREGAVDKVMSNINGKMSRCTCKQVLGMFHTYCTQTNVYLRQGEKALAINAVISKCDLICITYR